VAWQPLAGPGAYGLDGDPALGMTLQLVARDEVVNALPGDPEHRARHRIWHRLCRRVPDPPYRYLAQRRAPPFGGRREGRIPWVEAGDHPGDHLHGGPVVGPEHHRRPGLRTQPNQRPRGLDRFVPFEQDLQRIEQPDVNDTNQLVDELSTDGQTPLIAYLTPIVKYLTDNVKHEAAKGILRHPARMPEESRVAVMNACRSV
jgi:hypothetical protein